MRCKKAKELLSPYIDGELSKRDKETFESHMKSCVKCKQEVNETKHLKYLFACSERFSATYGLSTRVLANLETKIQGKGVPAPLFTKFAETLIVFLVIAIGMVSGSFVAGIVSLPRSALRNSEMALLSLEEFSPMPPDSLGGVYFAITGGNDEK